MSHHYANQNVPVGAPNHLYMIGKVLLFFALTMNFSCNMHIKFTLVTFLI